MDKTSQGEAYYYLAKIKTDSEAVLPFGNISGQVIIVNNVPIENKGIHIQFEGLCRFKTRKLEIDTETKVFIAGYAKYYFDRRDSEFDLDPGFKEAFWFDVPPTLNPGRMVLPFSLEIPGEANLPSEFELSCGSLNYRLSVYVHKPVDGRIKIGEKKLHFLGHSNLILYPYSFTPIEIKEVYFKSIFQINPTVDVVFSTEKSGFLRGEEMGFVMSISNRKCFPLVMTVSLVSTVKVQVKHATDREMTIICESKETGIIREPDYIWIESIPLGHYLMPSFEAENVFSVEYSVKFKVKISYYGEISGNAPVYIGTTTEPLRVLHSIANSIPESSSSRSHGTRLMSLPSTSTVEAIPSDLIREEGESPSSGFQRTGSPNPSTSFETERPPVYSQLSTRASSVETLPPNYDDVRDEDE